jgi:putative nucleotidyltransferase with HDIG domain
MTLVLQRRPDVDRTGSQSGGPLAVRRLLRRLEDHDPATARHCLRTCRNAELLADTLGLASRARRHLRVAALLHDLGKLSLPPELLNKPGRLTEDEARRVREHPAEGVRLLAPFLPEPAILEAIHGHHERFDGRGYPRGLKGHAIPLLARILSVADCLDAVTSGRPYRPRLTHAAAREYVRWQAGRQFDPVVVSAFLRAWDPATEMMPEAVG